MSNWKPIEELVLEPLTTNHTWIVLLYDDRSGVQEACFSYFVDEPDKYGWFDFEGHEVDSFKSCDYYMLVNDLPPKKELK